MSTPSPMTNIEAIKVRHSSRTFAGALSDERKALVEQFAKEANELPSPFGTNVEVQLHPPGLGKMGVISNEAGWLIGKIPVDIKEEEVVHAYNDLGYKMHYFILKLTQNNFDSIWIGGTYDAETAQKSTPGFTVPAGIPYGEHADARWRDGLMRWYVGASSRLPIADLFFEAPDNKPITEETAGDRLDFIQALRSCPSARMIQAWKYLIDGKTMHLYNSSDRPTCGFDIGIGLQTAVFYLQEKGVNPNVRIVENPPPPPIPSVYCISFDFQ